MRRELFPPDRTCAVCEKPFSWRKKWESCWDEVRYCSKRCRSQRSSKIPLEHA
ncbi:MAG: DUF2256 domain-containing protein [Flavobacteriales bacterium]|nr:DUF2256 domain-containing protein [Flavobacteriales bacterium]